MVIEKKAVTFAFALLAAGGVAMAQSGPVRPAYDFPGGERSSGVQMGDSAFYAAPYASVALGHDSNLFTSDINKVDSGTELYIVGAKVDTRDANSVFNMNIEAKYGRYNESSADNYSDPSFRGTYDVAFDQRNFLRVGYNYLRLHDPRGSTDRPPTNSRPDKYYDSTPSVVYAYGTKGAQGRLELYASNLVKRYLNNREYTVNYDRDVLDYGGTFYWRVMPKTSLLFEARQSDLDYKLEASKLSGNETRLYGGATWEATAATTGTVKLGWLEKKFDSDLKDYSGFNWEAVLNWQPLSYSTVNLYTVRLPVETTGLGTFTLSDRTGVNWTHGWSDVVTTDAFASYQKDRYQNADRTDEVSTLGVKASYKLRRWLTLGAEYSFTNRDSNLRLYEYDRHIYSIFAQMTM